jgi:hypothetical protein
MKAKALLAVLFYAALILGWATSGSAREPDYLVSSAFAALHSGDLSPFGSGLQARLRENSSYRDLIGRVGNLVAVEIFDQYSLPNAILVLAITKHSHGDLGWKVGYSSDTQKIEILEVRTTFDELQQEWQVETSRWLAQELAPKKELPTYGRPKIIPDLPAGEPPACLSYPALCAPKDSRTAEFLFATTRKKISDEPARFSGERAELSYGVARVRVPEGHKVGRIELPGWTLWNVVGYESKADERKHFIIRSSVQLSEDDWKNYIHGLKMNEALVFVHGYNTSFEEALYRNAQIIYDLKYTRGISVLFSWASNGEIEDYLYDSNSALNARASFLLVLRTLRAAGIDKIHILAHSMGNLVVLEALAGEARTANPLNIAQLIMAAPDVDYDAFKQMAPDLRRVTQG